MTGYNSKRRVAQDKLDDDDDTQVYADTLLVVYQRGFLDGKRSAEQQAEPTQWRDMVVVSLVREGIDKHKARELADHFAPQQQAEPVCMRMPRAGDRVICLEDESLGTVVSLTAGGSPDIKFDDGSRGTYMLREFAELFGYVTPPQQQAEPVAFYSPTKGFSWAKPTSIFAPTIVDVPPMPLYTSPPQRPWVGLTDEEIDDIYWGAGKHDLLDARAIEAKLKEKNT